MSEIEVLPSRPLDVKILALADSHSPEEISQRLGGVVSAKAVAARVAELLKTKNWLTAAQQDQAITLKMQGILATLEGRFMDIDNATLQLKILRELGTRLDKRAAATQVDFDRYDTNVGRKLGRVVDSTLTYMKGALREEIDADRWDELVEQAMQHARQQIAQNEIEE